MLRKREVRTSRRLLTPAPSFPCPPCLAPPARPPRLKPPPPTPPRSHRQPSPQEDEAQRRRDDDLLRLKASAAAIAYASSNGNGNGGLRHQRGKVPSSVGSSETGVDGGSERSTPEPNGNGHVSSNGHTSSDEAVADDGWRVVPGPSGTTRKARSPPAGAAPHAQTGRG